MAARIIEDTRAHLRDGRIGDLNAVAHQAGLHRRVPAID
jgi:hypothetical protein